MTTYELKVRERKRDGWKEHIPETSNGEKFDNSVDKIIDKYGADTKGSYRATFKINGGYGKNPETGATIDLNWKGVLSGIWEIINRCKPPENMPRDQARGEDKPERGRALGDKSGSESGLS